MPNKKIDVQSPILAFHGRQYRFQVRDAVTGEVKVRDEDLDKPLEGQRVQTREGDTCDLIENLFTSIPKWGFWAGDSAHINRIQTAVNDTRANKLDVITLPEGEYIWLLGTDSTPGFLDRKMPKSAYEENGYRDAEEAEIPTVGMDVWSLNEDHFRTTYLKARTR